MEDRPIAFLNLCNGEENNLDKWHWVVVVEIFEENGEYFLNIIDDKEILKINLSLWYRTITMMVVLLHLNKNFNI